MNQNISVTIGLLAMNHEKYIIQACESIAEQTYKNFEVVFVDNNSTDKTFELADEYFKKSGIKYKGIKNTVNKTVSQNLNLLVDSSTTEYITFLSGDDWYTPDNMEKKINFLLTSGFDIVFTDGYKYLQDTNATVSLYDDKSKAMVRSLDNYFQQAILGNYLYAIGFITKRQILIDNPYDETMMMEDWDMCLNLSSKGLKMGFLDEPLFYYRVLSTSLSNNRDVMEKDYFNITAKYIEHIKKDNKTYSKYRQKLHKSSFRDIEKKGTKNTDDKKAYAMHKKEYAMLKYSFPLNYIIAGYWSLKQ